MKIAIAGLWHLGCVTAACLADAHGHVIGYDANIETIHQLQQIQKAPIYEPGLDELIKKNVQQHQLSFTANPEDLAQADVIWVCYDTPVDDNDVADVQFVKNEIYKIYPHLSPNSLIIISSQIPVGSTRQLLNECQQQWPDKQIHFAVIPENLRLGKAIQVMTKPDRFVIGLQEFVPADFVNHVDKKKIQTLLQPFTENLIWMSLESAEMTKHAINAFLAMSVVFANELGTLCEKVGANASDVEIGLKTEERIGPKAYVRAGGAIGGGTLMRDIYYLNQIGAKNAIKTILFDAINESNHVHKQWPCNKITEILPTLQGKRITSLGLTYKTGTDTLRRSVAVETCKWLNQQGAIVTVYDPALQVLPADLALFIDLKSTLREALEQTDAVIIANDLEDLKHCSEADLRKYFGNALVFDPSGFLNKKLGHIKKQYYSVGIGV